MECEDFCGLAVFSIVCSINDAPIYIKFEDMNTCEIYTSESTLPFIANVNAKNFVAPDHEIVFQSHYTNTLPCACCSTPTSLLYPFGGVVYPLLPPL